jgi:hypothetical protein
MKEWEIKKCCNCKESKPIYDFVFRSNLCHVCNRARRAKNKLKNCGKAADRWKRIDFKNRSNIDD